jgi:hypothetical protein
MPDLDLLSLDLRSPLAYSGMENPPLSGAPLSGSVLLPSSSGSFREFGLGSAMDEGGEELFLFDEEDLVAFDPDEGPSLRRPLPRPRFYGRKPPRPEASPATMLLKQGNYAFLQWRPRDEAELEEGIEWFVREAWWQRVGASGPYILRRVREDGRLATQVLRRSDKG